MSRYPSPTRPIGEISAVTEDLPYYIEDRIALDLKNHITQLKQELASIPTVEMKEDHIHYCLEHENDDPLMNRRLLKENPFDETKKSKKTCVIL